MWTRSAVRFGGVLLLGVMLGQFGFGGSASQARTTSPDQAAAGTATAASASSAERTVWYFYTVKWGKQDEFLDLFQKNHYPLLKAQLGTRLVGVKTYTPTYHGSGRSDWTFAVAITFKDSATMTGPSPEEELARKQFKDYEKFRAEERERFAALEAHWDVPLTEVNFETRQPVVRR
jgi:hypothetical protein